VSLTQTLSVALPGGAFELVDHDGRPVTDQTYRGRHALLFFGFTHCRVVCPRALYKLSAALDDLGPLAGRIRALYVSVDPERDTPEVMRDFLRTYPRFTGLTGTRAQVDCVKQAFRVFATRAADAQDPDGYAVPHTAISYLLDAEGRLVDHFADVLSAQDVSARIRAQLSG